MEAEDVRQVLRIVAGVVMVIVVIYGLICAVNDIRDEE